MNICPYRVYGSRVTTQKGLCKEYERRKADDPARAGENKRLEENSQNRWQRAVVAVRGVRARGHHFGVLRTAERGRRAVHRR